MNTAVYILLGVGVGLSLFNWACLFVSGFSKRYISPVFPAPSVFIDLGLALFDQTRPYWWVGLLTDYTLFGLLIAVPSMVTAAWRTSSFTRVQLLWADDAPRRLELSLHRGGHFLLRATFEPPVSRNPHGACISSFGAVGHWQKMLDGRLRPWGYREKRVLTLRGRRQTTLHMRSTTLMAKGFPMMHLMESDFDQRSNNALGDKESSWSNGLSRSGLRSWIRVYDAA